MPLLGSEILSEFLEFFFLVTHVYYLFWPLAVLVLCFSFVISTVFSFLPILFEAVAAPSNPFELGGN